MHLNTIKCIFLSPYQTPEMGTAGLPGSLQSCQSMLWIPSASLPRSRRPWQQGDCMHIRSCRTRLRMRGSYSTQRDHLVNKFFHRAATKVLGLSRTLGMQVNKARYILIWQHLEVKQYTHVTIRFDTRYWSYKKKKKKSPCFQNWQFIFFNGILQNLLQMIYLCTS